MSDLKDFSSFDPEQERAFVPFEAAMKANEKRANTLGYSIAGGFLVLATAAVIGLYSPCSRFCERPPSACKSDSDIAAFKQNCADACRAMEKQTGLTITREIHIKSDDGKEQFEAQKATIDGSEWVDNLAACAFSGGGGATCESITKYATEKGLWCAEKK